MACVSWRRLFLQWCPTAAAACPRQSVVHCACYRGHEKVLRMWRERFGWDLCRVPELSCCAVEADMCASLRVLADAGVAFTRGTVLEAVMAGSLKCLRFFVECGLVDFLASRGVALSDMALSSHRKERFEMCREAARLDRLYALKYLNSCRLSADAQGLCNAAARGGSLSCMEWCLEQGAKPTRNLMRCAAVGGSLECVEYAHQAGCHWHTSACTEAAAFGNLQCLQYMHEAGCPWEINTTMAAACSSGSLDCLVYLVAQGCPVTPAVAVAARKTARHDCADFLLSQQGLNS